jgi:hypothetical protein
VYQVPAESQGQRGEGLTRHCTDAVDSASASEDIEDAQVGEFEHDEPEGILKRVRASKSSAFPAGLTSSPMPGTSLAPARHACWGTERVWGHFFNDVKGQLTALVAHCGSQCHISIHFYY